MLLRLDISKAFDRVSWEFLNHILQIFGFSKWWRKRINSCISTLFFIIINGEAEGYFNSMMGLRQGDLISPTLFTIMLEALGRSISVAIKVSTRGSFNPSYQLLQEFCILHEYPIEEVNQNQEHNEL